MSVHVVRGAPEPVEYTGELLTTEGTFLGEIIKTEERTRRKDLGVEQLEVEITLMVTDATSPDDGKVIRDWFYPNTKALYRMQRLLKALGLPYKGDFTWDSEEWIGSPVLFETYLDHFGGKDRLKVRTYHPAPAPQMSPAVLPPVTADTEDTP